MMSSWLVAFGILSTSFLGSLHCAGMCGPMATLMAQRQSLLSYHLGRLFAYVCLGIIAGAGGQFFLKSQFVTVRWVAVVILAVLLFVMGMAKFFPNIVPEKIKNLNFIHRFFFWLRKFQVFQESRSGLAIGLMTAFLPCGWLYTYVLAAAATQSPWAGGLTLFIFWLGGLPALSTLPFMIRQTVQSAGLRQQKIAGAILIFSSLYSLASFMFLH